MRFEKLRSGLSRWLYPDARRYRHISALLCEWTDKIDEIEQKAEKALGEKDMSRYAGNRVHMKVLIRCQLALMKALGKETL